MKKADLSDFELINRGKVRDVYRIDDESLLFVASDRISAFDCVMPNQIPGKGIVLTSISDFWFDFLEPTVKNHRLLFDFDKFPDVIRQHGQLRGRAMIVRRLDIFPVECVVRGYLEGSGWKDYQSTGSVCGHRLPKGLRQCEELPEPLFTPATKEASGHDVNIDFDTFCDIVGTETGTALRDLTLEIYRLASQHANERGIIIADTKFEFGADRDGNIVLADEVLTPDSSRFWDASQFQPGTAQASFDKQFVREYLETLDWDKTPPAPELPEEIVIATIDKYKEAFFKLTGGEIALT